MPSLPLPEADSAFFFDFDGTLVDLADRPEAVQVAPGLARDLLALQRRAGGALAIITGRPVAQVDARLWPAQLPSAGVHGAERRAADGRWHRCPLPALDGAAARLEAFCADHPGLRLERKPGALALHYRGADAFADAALRAMEDAQARTVDGDLVLLHGKKVIELKPAAVDKGRAVAAFMAEPPFAGRRPWCFGDDVTDEAAFEAVLAWGGVAVKVGAGASVATGRLDDPAALRAWLRGVVAEVAA
jgi:trehalose 6-phosphate phosphatase